ncbi:class I SAM-dependent methyltransferase [Solemya velum gill symbiont]|uniref:Methyltransferase domain-containing protein n=1 Tax=Solemya velum gill symbiont TaxID=2340 RepID=A0A0B0H8I5_SOVGS|nr:class I SAM-dependent methyltransferase [Solemya velum gill symbiont]KHF25375.1 methyltransferase domain-containing protein [Solemya velum gill symbiont]OOZ44937.1 hypothetical protein BOW37_04850 [Solemya velum gill symbiont]OOZ47476.1 hypothetical protein BOW38_02630 [Solemya velum gill symbiont]OOZ49944.1 hypothetical protein BOW39_04385 [Solemya velum gill symbiont]OOZ51683.1 hypothetical protein BOW40_06380 [Solemya velum gill symbiont]
MKNIDELIQSPQFSSEAIEHHIDMLGERVFQVKTKWPHFNLLLRDLRSLSERLEENSLVISLERGLLYGGSSLAAPVFSGHRVIAADCSPASADDRGAYNETMVDDARFLSVPSSIRTNIEKTDLPGAKADLVIVPNLVHHIADQSALFSEISRLLKPGGLAYVFEPLVRELHQSPDDFLRYTPYGLENILKKNGLHPLETKTEGGPFSVIAYSWAQALEYIPQEDRSELNEWFYNEHFPQLMEWDTKYPNNQERKFTSFPMAFSVLAQKKD